MGVVCRGAYPYAWNGPPVLRLGDDTATGTCAATAAEIAIARATFTNSSCSYANLTVGSLLN